MQKVKRVEVGTLIHVVLKLEAARMRATATNRSKGVHALRCIAWIGSFVIQRSRFVMIRTGSSHPSHVSHADERIGPEKDVA